METTETCYYCDGTMPCEKYQCIDCREWEEAVVRGDTYNADRIISNTSYFISIETAIERHEPDRVQRYMRRLEHSLIFRIFTSNFITKFVKSGNVRFAVDVLLRECPDYIYYTLKSPNECSFLNTLVSIGCHESVELVCSLLDPTHMTRIEIEDFSISTIYEMALTHVNQAFNGDSNMAILTCLLPQCSMNSVSNAVGNAANRLNIPDLLSASSKCGRIDICQWILDTSGYDKSVA
jgi:hypothetical protein